MLVGCALVAVLGLAAAVAARHRAESAADLAALAAADRMLVDPAGACAEAVRVAAAQRAELTSCVLSSDAERDSVLVAVESPLAGPDGLFAGLPPARGRARAGPLSTAPYAGAPASSRVSSPTEPALSSGSFPLPHLGDWIHDGQPRSHSQAVIAARVALSQGRARWKPRSAKPAPPGWPS
ncbi:hypothetical protein GXW82_30520 [Streptacidiphilus sp. 4-A2]|nr:hypothetical protein [Streptacidiphilus sp. 4-A2]